ncbi:MAG: hypothetical protein NZZ60_05365 [Bacteroidia bacterium]|nr:hypothetical protein [Bacteroidia bacterium]MCX7652816.1 hypothetical protein [Bacteroidia bacterium]MDW8415925.1 hypothetical protein [Bacteroidia bacterium]
MTSSSPLPPSRGHKKYSALLTPLIAIVGGGLAYAIVKNAYPPKTALACAAVYAGLGVIHAVSFFIGTRSVQQILVGIYIRMLFALGLTLALAVFFKPAFEPFLLNAVIAIILMQILHIIFSL